MLVDGILYTECLSKKFKINNKLFKINIINNNKNTNSQKINGDANTGQLLLIKNKITEKILSKNNVENIVKENIYK